MKKHVLFSAAMVAALAASAQTGEITSNRGENWLSQSGDWGLTFGADPLLQYAGNLFNNGTNTAPTLDGFFQSNSSNSGNLPGVTNGVVIGGKKLIDANTAYRGKLRIGFGSDKTTFFVNDATSTTIPPAVVEDVTKVGFMAVDLGFGLEKRVGSTRVVGIYGAEAHVGFGSGKTTNEFGNALSATNSGPRTTEAKESGTFQFGLNAFAGVEWFCAPKISLSGEYAWGLNMTSTGAGESTTERFDAATNAIVTTTTEGNPNDEFADKNSSFGIDTQLRGSLGINFYFQ